MSEYADQRAHDVDWMTAAERENLATGDVMIIGKPASALTPGEIVSVPTFDGRTHSGYHFARVTSSQRSGWAPGTADNPWWRLLFEDGNVLECAASHRFSVHQL